MKHSSVDILLQNPVSFLDNAVPADNDIAISSRIRLARNLKDFPFPTSASDEILQRSCDTVLQAAVAADVFGGVNMLVFDPSEMESADRDILLERRLASKEFIQSRHPRLLLVDPDEENSLMINEEDTLRIQAIKPGLQLHAVWRQINRIDNELGKQLQFAFDEQFGYLTSCPTNVGTGMRASVMLHLPGLVMTGQIGPTIHGIGKLHLAVRGIFGEGSENSGNFFQISNQSTLGEGELKIIDELESVIRQIIQQEKNARRKLLNNDRFTVLDQAGRAYGVLRYSYKLGFEETLQLLSGLRIGVDMGLFQNIDIKKINDLFIETAPAHMQKRHPGAVPEELDICRAALCREKLRG